MLTKVPSSQCIVKNENGQYIYIHRKRERERERGPGTSFVYEKHAYGPRKSSLLSKLRLIACSRLGKEHMETGPIKSMAEHHKRAFLFFTFPYFLFFKEKE